MNYKLQNKLFPWLTAILLLPFMIACGDGDDMTFNESDLTELTDETVEPVNDSILEEIIGGIPSPVEMTDMLLASGADYSTDVLNIPDNIDQYTTGHRKALNLGVYGADLGYLNMYGKTGTSLDYLKTIKQLSDDLSVGQFFDFDELKELASTDGNLDTLILISTRNFGDMNRYLREHQRGKISVLVVTGTFIEGLNIATQTMKRNPHPDIRENIAYQKLTVEQVIEILDVYGHDPMFLDLKKDFESLYAVMNDVTIEITSGETTWEEVDGVLTAVQNDESNVELTDETLDQIISKTAEIRNKIVS